MSQQENILFQDTFDIKDIDPNGKHFDRVSRLVARSENYEMDLILDFNNEVYPLDVNDKFSLVLASTLSLDTYITVKKSKNPEDDEKLDSWRERAPGERDLSDEYEYVMYGKVYRYDDSQSGAGTAGDAAEGQRVSVYISFGGLLMCLEGEYRHVQNIVVGEHVYLLIRK